LLILVAAFAGGSKASAATLGLHAYSQSGGNDNSWTVYQYVNGYYYSVAHGTNGGSGSGWTVSFSITSTNPILVDGSATVTAPGSANGVFSVLVSPGPTGLGSGNQIHDVWLQCQQWNDKRIVKQWTKGSGRNSGQTPSWRPSRFRT